MATLMAKSPATRFDTTISHVRVSRRFLRAMVRGVSDPDDFRYLIKLVSQRIVSMKTKELAKVLRKQTRRRR